MGRLARWWRYSRYETAYYNIKHGLRNLIVYFPLIWRTRDWDYYFLYDFLLFKISKTRVLIEEHGNETSKSRLRKVKYMKMCEYLIKRLMEDDYVYCRSVWGDGISSWGMKVEYYHPLAPSRDDDKMDMMVFFKLEERRKKQDQELLYKILMKHGEGWWD